MLKDMASSAAFDEVWKTWLGGCSAPPARAMYQVTELPREASVEIVVVATPAVKERITLRVH